VAINVMVLAHVLARGHACAWYAVVWLLLLLSIGLNLQIFCRTISTVMMEILVLSTHVKLALVLLHQAMPEHKYALL
jgi:hypothetical protein